MNRKPATEPQAIRDARAILERIETRNAEKREAVRAVERVRIRKWKAATFCRVAFDVSELFKWTPRDFQSGTLGELADCMRADALAALREEFPKAYTHTEKRERVRVVFRAWPDDSVIALFPDIDYGGGRCSSSMHVGQHSGADYSHVMSVTRPARPAEYAPLLRELESAPYWYDLRVIARR